MTVGLELQKQINSSLDTIPSLSWSSFLNCKSACLWISEWEMVFPGKTISYTASTTWYKCRILIKTNKLKSLKVGKSKYDNVWVGDGSVDGGGFRSCINGCVSYGVCDVVCVLWLEEQIQSQDILSKFTFLKSNFRDKPLFTTIVLLSLLLFLLFLKT